MTGRTFSKAQWEEAQGLWKSGEFSDEWKPFRHEAAMRGFLYPPEGTKWDSWDDDEPSQRAIVIRAIRETPKMLHEAIAHTRNWHGAIAYIMRRHEEWRDELNAIDRETARRKAELEGEPRDATMTLRSILSRIGDS